MSLRHCVVWFLLAMLPLRGIAISTMEMPTGVFDGVVMELGVTGATNPQPPCHGDATDLDAGPTESTCGLCDLCHNAVAAAAAFDASAPNTPEALPPPDAANDTGRHAVGGLDRPPRRFRA
jgi:hypothetical protein